MIRDKIVFIIEIFLLVTRFLFELFYLPILSLTESIKDTNSLTKSNKDTNAVKKRTLIKAQIITCLLIILLITLIIAVDHYVS